MTASSHCPTTEHRRQRGFSLVELAVVLTIVALLLSSLLYTFSAQVEQRNRNETEQRLAEARELLLGFAIVNGRLPCPATAASYGVEAPAGGGAACTSPYNGFLPAVTIGFKPIDALGFGVDSWGNRIRYALDPVVWNVTGRFNTAHTSTAWALTNTPANIVVCNVAPGGGGNTCDANTSVTNLNTVAVVVLSTGKNGATGGTGTNEARNVDATPLFVWRAPDPNTAAGGEYDDLVSWIPVGLLYGRMVAAGVLP